MNILLAVVAPIFPFLTIFIPGLFIVPWSDRPTSFLSQLARAILWSIVINSLLALILTALSLPPVGIFLIGLVIAAYFFVRHRLSFDRQSIFTGLLALLIFLVVFLVFSSAFLIFHDGLPTGDAQKSIYWAEFILSHHSLPNYALSLPQLNRDPVDFYTPALHSLTAAVMQPAQFFAADLLGYTAVGFLAIVLSLSVVVIAMATVNEFNIKTRRLILFLTPVLILTHFRFLRYLREPGYHLQNIAGELLLFGSLLLLLSLLRQPNRRDFSLLLLTCLTLTLTHQFSAFLAVFILAPSALTLLFINWPKIKSRIYLKHSSYLLVLLAAGFLLVLWLLGLFNKLPHLFNRQPHLLSLTPNLTDYINLMGFVWLSLGLLGLVLMYRTSRRLPAQIFVVSTIVILIFSQAPRLYIDVPPVRALLYSVIPLSITGAVFLGWLLSYLYLRRSFASVTTIIALLAITFFSVTSSVVHAFNLSHTVRTNSTFLPEHYPFITFLRSQLDQSALLIDDYNRRSSSWLILSQHPTFSRLSSDLKRQMQEAQQSSTRSNLYLKQLDFEKIYMLGSRPELSDLLIKNNINWLIGVNNSSASGFTHNPTLQPVLTGSDLTLFSLQPISTNLSANMSDYSHWLIRPTTLVNDIGDQEDTFLHLPASLQSARLSPPQYNQSDTYRTTTAPLIPLYFNVNDYLAALWDQDGDNLPDTTVQISIKTIEGLGTFRIWYDDSAFNVPADGTPVNISSSQINLSASPYLVFTIDNPSQSPINLDLIALGLSRIP